jgi:hypothetical protein
MRSCVINAPARGPGATPEWRFLEREARRLRAEYAGDPLARLFMEIDFRIRDLAHRIAARLLSPGSTRTSPR